MKYEKDVAVLSKILNGRLIVFTKIEEWVYPF